MNDDIKQAIKTMRDGGVILYPTDTVWGLGCDATDDKAVRRIYEIKQRVDNKAMLVLVNSVAKLQGYVEEVPEMAYELIEMSRKPLTVIYDRGRNFAASLLGEDGSIGIRVTNEAFSHQLCLQFRRPVVSTSANVSGRPTPRNYSQIEREIIDAVDYVVKYRQDDASEPAPSSIIKLSAGNMITIIRE